jgi:hypothetical protein
METETGPFGAQVVGPFLPESKIIVNGYIVPHLSVGTVKGGPNDGLFCLQLDNPPRWEVQCTQEELDKWSWFIAHAMAVAAGMTCHGEGSKPKNIHSQKCSAW